MKLELWPRPRSQQLFDRLVSLHDVIMPSTKSSGVECFFLGIVDVWGDVVDPESTVAVYV